MVDVAVIGVGQTGYGTFPEKDMKQLFVEAFTEALVDGLLHKLELTPEKVNHVALQEPDASKSFKAVSKLGFPKEALALGTIATYTGDTGVASSLLSLAHVLDHAHGSERILVASYRSGSDAFSLLVQEEIVQRRE